MFRRLSQAHRTDGSAAVGLAKAGRGAKACGSVCQMGQAGVPGATRPTEVRGWGRANAAWVRLTIQPRSRLDIGARARRRLSAEPHLLREASVAAMARRLRGAGIVFPYLFSGPFRLDGTLPPHPFDGPFRRRVEVIREKLPGASPLPWIGGVQGKQLRLDDPGWAAAAVAEIARLMDALDVTGVHVDFEDSLLVQPHDPGYPRNFNRFFEELRAALPHAFVSAVIPSTAPAVVSWKQRHSVEEVDELVTTVDQLAVMFYDTSLQDVSMFEESFAIQVDHLARWKVIAPQVQLLVGVGTFVNGPRLRAYRNLEVESIESHFRALDRATGRHPGQVVDGTAVFCEWTTSRSQWARLRPFLT